MAQPTNPPPPASVPTPAPVLTFTTNGAQANPMRHALPAKPQSQASFQANPPPPPLPPQIKEHPRVRRGRRGKGRKQQRDGQPYGDDFQAPAHNGWQRREAPGTSNHADDNDDAYSPANPYFPPLAQGSDSYRPSESRSNGAYFPPLGPGSDSYRPGGYVEDNSFMPMAPGGDSYRPLPPISGDCYRPAAQHDEFRPTYDEYGRETRGQEAWSERSSRSPSPGRAGRSGVGRASSPSPDRLALRRMTRPRDFRWPLVDGYQVAQMRNLHGQAQTIKSIAISLSGDYVAVHCSDEKIHMWSTATRQEVAKLAHAMPVERFAFTDERGSLLVLHEQGGLRWEKHKHNVMKWLKSKFSGWDFGPQPVFARTEGRLATANKAGELTVWTYHGTGAPQRPQRLFVRPSISAMQFVEDGEALVGGTSDGLLWYARSAGGSLRSLQVFDQAITSIDVDSEAGRALVSFADGHAVLFNLQPGAGVERTYAPEEASRSSFGALFAAGGKAVVYGTSQGCALVWDTLKAQVVYGMNNSEDDPITCAAAFDGHDGKPGYILTGSKSGQIVWWAQPSSSSKKRTVKKEPAT